MIRHDSNLTGKHGELEGGKPLQTNEREKRVWCCVDFVLGWTAKAMLALLESSNQSVHVFDSILRVTHYWCLKIEYFDIFAVYSLIFEYPEYLNNQCSSMHDLNTHSYLWSIYVWGAEIVPKCETVEVQYLNVSKALNYLSDMRRVSNEHNRWKRKQTICRKDECQKMLRFCLKSAHYEWTVYEHVPPQCRGYSGDWAARQALQNFCRTLLVDSALCLLLFSLIYVCKVFMSWDRRVSFACLRVQAKASLLGEIHALLPSCMRATLRVALGTWPKVVACRNELVCIPQKGAAAIFSSELCTEWFNRRHYCREITWAQGECFTERLSIAVSRAWALALSTNKRTSKNSYFSTKTLQTPIVGRQNEQEGEGRGDDEDRALHPQGDAWHRHFWQSER